MNGAVVDRSTGFHRSEAPLHCSALFRLDVQPDVDIANGELDRADEAAQYGQATLDLVPHPDDPIEVEQQPSQVGCKQRPQPLELTFRRYLVDRISVTPAYRDDEDYKARILYFIDKAIPNCP